MELEERSELERRARQAFDASVEALDARTRSRLTQARHAAVAELRPHRVLQWRGLAPLAGVAAALVAGVLLWRPSSEPSSAAGTVAGPEEIEIAFAGDDLDLVSEDLGFYALVEAQAGTGTGGVG